MSLPDGFELDRLPPDADPYSAALSIHPRFEIDEDRSVIVEKEGPTTSQLLDDEGVGVPAANVGVVLSGSGSEREFTQRLGRILRPKSEGGRAILYEVVSAETAEERVAARRR